jgi:hypothetical protein
MRIVSDGSPIQWVHGGDTGVFSLGNPTCHGAYEAYNFQLYAATTTTGIATLNAGSLVGGSYTPNGTYTDVRLQNNSGVDSAIATVVISGGAITSVTLTNAGNGYVSTDTLSFEFPASAGVTFNSPGSIGITAMGATGYSMINHSLYFDPVGQRWVFKDEDHDNILFSFSPNDKSRNCCPSKLNQENLNYAGTYGSGTFTGVTGIVYTDEEFWIRYDANAIYNDTIIYMSEGTCEGTDCDDLFSCKDSNFLKKQNNELAKDVAEIRDLEIFGFGGGGFDWDSLIKRNMVIHSLRCMPYGVLSDAETDCLKNKLTDKCNC